MTEDIELIKSMKAVEIREIQIGDAAGLLEFFEKLVEADPERVERIEDVKAFDAQKRRGVYLQAKNL